MVRALYAACVAGLAAAGCQVLSGVDDLTFGGPDAQASGGQSGGGQGGGGQGGGGQGGTGATGPDGSAATGGTNPGGAGGSEVGGGGGNDPTACMVAISDDFDDGVIAPGLWTTTTDGNLDIVETNGRLVMTAPAGASGWTGLRGLPLFDLASCGILIRVVSFPQGPGVFLAFGLSHEKHDGYVEHLFADGELRARVFLGNQVVTDYVIGDQSSGTWWRLRGSGGQIIWEASMDGVQWDFLTSQSMQFDPSALAIVIGMGTFPGVATSQATGASVDDLNLPPPI
jgi:hypothetical protein